MKKTAGEREKNAAVKNLEKQMIEIEKNKRKGKNID